MILILIAVLFYAIPIVAYAFKLILTKWLRKSTNKHHRMQQKILIDELKKIYKEEREPLYQEAQKLFKECMQQGILKRNEILVVKRMIKDSLKAYEEEYKDYKFQNDAHEIYTKFKNIHITENDWINILNYLNNIKLARSKVS